MIPIFWASHASVAREHRTSGLSEVAQHFVCFYDVLPSPKQVEILKTDRHVRIGGTCQAY